MVDAWLHRESIGPRIPAEGMTPFDPLPSQAADMMLIWLWQAELNTRLGSVPCVLYCNSEFRSASKPRKPFITLHIGHVLVCGI